MKPYLRNWNEYTKQTWRPKKVVVSACELGLEKKSKDEFFPKEYECHE